MAHERARHTSAKGKGETTEAVACTECGGSGHGPDRSVGAGDVENGKCDRCDGLGLEGEAKNNVEAVRELRGVPEWTP